MSFNLALHQVRLSNYQISEEKEKKREEDGRSEELLEGKWKRKDKGGKRTTKKRACVQTN